MISRILAVLIFALVLIQPHALAAAPQDGPEPPFDLMAKTLQDFIGLEIKNDKPILQIPEDRETAQQIYQSLIGILRSGGGGGGGNTSWNYSAGNENYSDAIFQIRHQALPDSTFDSVRYDETVKPFRKVEMYAEGEDNFYIHIVNPSDQTVAILSQDKKHGISLTLLEQGECQFAQSDSWNQLVLKQGKLLSKFGAVLSKNGIRNKYSDFYPALMNELATELIEPVPPPTEFKELVDSLRSTKFKVREEATRRIAESFEKYKSWIVQVSKDESIHPEVRSRLQRLLLEHAEPGRKAARELLRDQDLLNQPGVIVQAWESQQAKKDGVADNVFQKQLEKLTGESHPDFAAWKKAVAEVVETTGSNEAQAPDLVELKTSPIQDFVSLIKIMCQLTENEKGQVRFDRDAWTAEFGGKTPAQLHEEMVKFAAERNLPNNWIIDKNKMQEYQHADLIFERIKEKCLQDKKAGIQHFYSSQTSYFTAARMQGGLATKEPKHRRRARGLNVLNLGDKESSRIDFRIGERGSSGVRMHLFETKLKSLVVVTVPTENTTIFLTGKRNTLTMHHIQNGKVFALKGKSLSELWDANQPYFEGTLVPFLAQVGIQLKKK